MTRITTAFACLLLLALSDGWTADSEEPSKLDTVVVTGTWLAGTMANVSNSNTIITREEIEARQDLSVLDLLRATAGVQVTQNGGRGGVSSVFVRGGEPNFTIVMIDGIKVNDPNNTRGGSFDFSTLEIAEVERIEIVRGSQSAVYGSDALSGVINIITREGARETSATADAGYGDDDYWQAAGRLSGPIGEAGDYSLRVGKVDDGEPVDGSHFDSTMITGKASLNASEALSLGFTGRYADSNSKSFPEDSGGPDYAVIRQTSSRDQKDLALGSRFTWDMTPRWALNGSASWYRHKEKDVSPGIAPGVRDGVPPTTDDAKLERTEVTLHAVFDVSDTLTATAGADYRREDGNSEGFVEFAPGFEVPSDFDIDRNIFGYFAEARYDSTAGLSLQGSLRYDDPEDAGSETTYKAGAVYSFGDGATRAFANWGKGFKLPSFFALASPLVGNPDLKPEKSESWDVGLGHALLDGSLWVNLTWFNNEFKDLIDFDFDLFTNINRSRVNTEGLEFEAQWRLNDAVGLTSHLTYTNIDTHEPGTKLRQRPEWRGGISAQWRPTPDWLVDLDWLYVDDTFDSSVPTGGVTLDRYNRVDVAVTWDATSRLSMILAIDNLLDENFEEAVGFPAPGFRPRLTARYQF